MIGGLTLSVVARGSHLTGVFRPARSSFLHTLELRLSLQSTLKVCAECPHYEADIYGILPSRQTSNTIAAMDSAKSEEHQAGRRAREVYRYFRPERQETIHENTSSPAKPIPSPKPPTETISFSGEQDLPVDSHPLPDVLQQTSKDTWAHLQPMPESLVLGDANDTLNSFAQLAALRLNVERVFIR